MKWEIGLRLQIVSNPALFAVLVQRDVFSKKFSTKLVKTFDRSCKIFEKLFVFDDFFCFYVAKRAKWQPSSMRLGL